MKEKTYAQSHLEIFRRRHRPGFVWCLFDQVPVQEMDANLFDRIRKDWLQRLIFLRCNKERHPTLARDFAEFLIAHQRTESDNQERSICAGSWAIPADTQMESDARVDYMYYPTYIAVAVLSLIWQDYPEIADSLNGFEEAFKSGLKFASGRNLQGHGYEDVSDSLTAIEYLALGKVFTNLSNDWKISTRFLRAISKAKKGIEEQIEKQQHPRDVDWSAIDEERGIIALGLLKGYDKYDTVVCRRPTIAPAQEGLNVKSEAENEDVDSDPDGDVVKNAIEEVMLILAVHLTPLIIDELSQRKAEIDEMVDAVRPKNPAHKNMGRHVYTDEIVLKTRFRIPEAIQEVSLDKVGDELLGSQKFIDRLKYTIAESLQHYIDSRDINNGGSFDDSMLIEITHFHISDCDSVVPVIKIGVL